MPTHALAILLAAAWAAGPADPTDGVDPKALAAAQATLTELVTATPRDAASIQALVSTNDKALAPLLEAMCFAADHKTRMFAVLTLGSLDADGTEKPLHRVFETDADAAIRLAALNQLLARDKATEAEIDKALADADNRLALLAARELVKRGQTEKASPILARLIERGEKELAVLARLVALAGGQVEHLPVLREALASDEFSDGFKMVLLRTVADDAIDEAKPAVAELLSIAKTPPAVLIAALRAMASLDAPAAAEAAAKALGDESSIVWQIELVNAMVAMDKPEPRLEALAGSPDELVAALARFELAHRGEDAEAIGAATAKLIKIGHPIVIQFVLNRAELKPSEAYVAPLLDYIAALPPAASRLTVRHEVGARAVALLVKIDSDAAIDALEKILRGPFNAVSRTVGGGLVTAEGKRLARLALAAMDSPYGELKVDGAFALGKSGDARAAPVLEGIALGQDAYPKPLRVMGAWHLIRIAGKADDVAKELAEKVR